jgi:peptide/nickel transport system permease protein
VRTYVLRRLLAMALTVLLVSMIAFSLLLLLPGDAAIAILGEQRGRDQEAYERLRHELGLDRPLPLQYLDWLGKALRGNLGTSIRTQEPVWSGIRARLPATLWLSAGAMMLALLVAVPVGILSAVRPDSKLDVTGTVLAMSGVAMPPFWLGIVLIFVLAVWLRWLPPSGFVSPLDDPATSLKLMVMPAVTLGAGLAGVLVRQVRSALLDVLQQEYVTVARAKGLAERLVVRKHALRNALVPVVTIIGLQTGRLFGGAVVVETIFSIPGVGRLAVDSIYFRDFPMVQGVVLVLALAVVLANLVTDILYGYIDPRIRYA